MILTDFSAAEVASVDLPAVPEPIEAGETFARPDFMAPEQILGETAGPASDVWALGVLCHELLTGARPFAADDPREIAQRVRSSPPTPLPARVPPALARAVARCLAKDPGDRFPDANAAASALEEALASMSRLPVPVLVSRALAAAGRGDALSPPGAPSPEPRVATPGLDVAGAARRLAVVLGLIVAGGVGLRLLDDPDAAESEGVAEAAPAGVASRDRGLVRVVARPWAEVYVDGELADTTPVGRPIPVAPGRHFVTFRHPNAPDEQRSIKITAGQSVFLDVTMRVDRGGRGGEGQRGERRVAVRGGSAGGEEGNLAPAMPDGLVQEDVIARRASFARIVEGGGVVRLRALESGEAILGEALSECAALGHAPFVEMRLGWFVEPDFQARVLPGIRGVSLEHGVPAEARPSCSRACWRSRRGPSPRSTASASSCPARPGLRGSSPMPRSARCRRSGASSRDTVSPSRRRRSSRKGRRPISARGRETWIVIRRRCARTAPPRPSSRRRSSRRSWTRRSALPGSGPLVVDFGCGVAVALLGLVALASRSGVDLDAVGLDRGYDGVLHGDSVSRRRRASGVHPGAARREDW